MKRFISLAMASVFIGSVFFFGCSGFDTDADSESSSSTEYTSSAAGSYASVGRSVTATLESKFNTKDDAKAFLENFSDEDENALFSVSIENLRKEGKISETVASYLTKIDAAMDSAQLPSEVISNIDAVEKDALANLSGDDLTAVMNSAETARAAFMFFNNAENDSSERGWGWFKRKAKKVAKSAGIGAAMGAVTGAVTGAVAGATTAGIGAVPGAIGGAIVGGTISGVASGLEEAVGN